MTERAKSQDNNLDPLSLSQMPRRRPACYGIQDEIKYQTEQSNGDRLIHVMIGKTDNERESTSLVPSITINPAIHGKLFGQKIESKLLKSG